MNKAYVCMNSNGDFEVWSQDNHFHAGHSFDLKTGELISPTVIKKIGWMVEVEFHGFEFGARYRIYSPIARSSHDNGLVTKDPTFWGREILGEL